MNKKTRLIVALMFPGARSDIIISTSRINDNDPNK